MSFVTGTTAQIGDTASGKLQAAIEKTSGDMVAVENKRIALETKRLIITGVLSAAVGTFGLIKQHAVAREYLALAKEQTAQAERYLRIAEDNYNTIAVPTFRCQKDLFTRYLSQFGGYEIQYLTDAFRLQEYVPEYVLQEGRAIGYVSNTFDRARLQRRRQVGRFNAGRACHDATMFSIQEALAKTAAINHAYRFEENRKFKYDQWYFNRRTQGIGIVDSMGSRVVSGLNGGAAVSTGAINAISASQGALANTFDSVTTGFNNLGNFFGGIANAGFSQAGASFGRLSTLSAAGNGSGAVSSSIGSNGIPNQVSGTGFQSSFQGAYAGGGGLASARDVQNTGIRYLGGLITNNAGVDD